MHHGLVTHTVFSSSKADRPWGRRWIIPYSEQFKFIMLSHVPFLPKRVTARWINSWLESTYRRAGINHVRPLRGSACNFTGQCNDAFFRLAKLVRSLEYD